MKKNLALVLVTFSCASISADIINVNNLFSNAVSASPDAKKRVWPEEQTRGAADNLCDLYNCAYQCSKTLLAQTEQDVVDSDPALANYIKNNTAVLEKRFDEMATSYAQDVTSAINTNVTAGAIAYLTYHNELTKYDNVIAIFYADWFNPYQLMRPALEHLSEKYANKVLFMEINANTMHIYGIDIKHIPTLIFYKESAAVDIHVGLGIDDEMFQEIARNVSQAHPHASPNEISDLIRTQATAEIERILDGLIQEHFAN